MCGSSLARSRPPSARAHIPAGVSRTHVSPLDDLPVNDMHDPVGSVRDCRIGLTTITVIP
jgi:hypothetical protein